MALVTAFEEADFQPKTHPTTVICKWSVLKHDGQAQLLQLDTRGSNHRENPNKLSQTLQFSRETAKELFEILKSEFQFE